MPGFNISIGKYNFDFEAEQNHLKYDKLHENHFTAIQFTLKKFEDDKLFLNQNGLFLILEGIILNKKNLQGSFETWERAVVKLYKEKGDTFFKEFRGSFSGALFDKRKEKWIVFTDHIGTKNIYYSNIDKELYISSEIVQLYNLFQDNKISYSLDRQGAYMLLSYGYMLDDYTLCDKIRKLKPGCYIVFKQGQFSVKKYHTLPKEYDESITGGGAIEKVDHLFKQAVKLQFEKDVEYNHKHLVALSGGLDSRMASWVAHEMGYTDQLNFTFSQSDYLDETIAKEIAAALKHEWIFKALDNGLFLKELNRINKISGGNVIYYGLAHGYSVLRYINFDNLGILHSGQLGDVILGSYINKLKSTYTYTGQGAYSKKLINKLKKYGPIDKTSISMEQYLMQQRGFNGILTGNLPSQLYTETMSPFYDVDFISYCLKIPLKLRINHKLYKKWILKRYPKAANYIWQKTQAKITDNRWGIPYKGYKIPFKRLPAKILKKLGILKSGTHSSFHMNPLGYWYKNNPTIKAFQDTYFQDNIERLKGMKEIKSDCRYLYKNGSPKEKNQVLTLLAALKLFF